MSENTKFDFETLLKQFDPAGVARQFQEIIANSPLGNFDPADMAESQKKTLEAIKQANEAAISGTHSLMTRQSEMMQQAMTDAAEAMQNLANAEPSEVANENVAMMESAVKKSMENFGEIAEMIEGIYSEISGKVEKRMEESVEELNEVIRKTKK